MNPGEDQADWSTPASELFSRLSSSAGGLSSQEAKNRARRFGLNSPPSDTSGGVRRILLRQFTNPLVVVLIIAAALALFVQEWVDALLVLTILFASAMLGFIQEYRASVSAARLKHRLALRSNVLRDGQIANIRSSHLVPGDVVMLSAGDKIPADGRVIGALDFLVSEASITGESFPVEKTPGELPVTAKIAGHHNMVYQGSSVRSGTAKLLVTKTGAQTILGKIAGQAAKGARDTEFMSGIQQFGVMLLRVVMVIVLTVFTMNLLMDRAVIGSLMFALALAVGMSPELLPAIISITLSRGAQSLARAGVLVRRLNAIENLGSMDILCADKTGTLTSGRTELYETLDAGGKPWPELLQMAVINARLETGIRNPLDTAIVAAGKRRGFDDRDYQKIAEIPYDFIRRRLTIVASETSGLGKHLMITKGAFSNILQICSSVMMNDRQVPLAIESRAQLNERYEQLGRQGFRVLGLAVREWEPKDRYARSDEADMVFWGFLVFHDPVRKGVREVLRSLQQLGVSVRVMTGDNRYVTAHLAEIAGLDPLAMLTGEEVSQLKDEALRVQVRTTQLFVEIDPQQKERIVRALQQCGHCVGFIGDGINDVPALEVADVGISVRGAVDVARESADIVLIHAGLDVLRKGIEEGRRTAVNTLKYLTITTSANFGNMVSMALATPWLAFLALAPKQILLNNFLSDLPALLISSDNVDREQISRPVRWDIRRIRRSMLVFGLHSSLFDMLAFLTLILVFQATQAEFQSAWFLMSLFTEIAILFVLRTRGHLLQNLPSRLLVVSSITVAVIGVLMIFSHQLGQAFGFVPIDPSVLGFAFCLVIAFALSGEWLKRREIVGGPI